MIENIRAGADINAGDGGYSLGTQEKYDEFVKGRNQSLGKMRIRELAIKANPASKEIYESDSWEFNCAAWDSKNLEKFAELIVLECVHNYRIKHGEYLRTGQHIDEYEHANNMLTQLGFKKLFGVEE
jgi:hypothetical protein